VSIASHVSATATVAASRQQQQTVGSTPDTDSDPFAALLDAIAAGSETTKTASLQPNGPQAALPPDSSATKALPAEGTSGANALDLVLKLAADNAPNAKAGSDAAPAPATASTAGAVPAAPVAATVSTTTAATLPAATNAKTAGTASVKGKLSAILNAANRTTTAASDPAAADAPAPPASAPNPPSVNANAAAAAQTATPADNSATTTAAPPASKPWSKFAAQTPVSGTSDDSGSQSGTAADATATSQPSQPASAPEQPVATAIVVDTQISAAPAAAQVQDAAIGDATKSRGKPALAFLSEQNAATAPAGNESAPTKSAEPAATTSGARQSGISRNATNTAASSGTPVQSDSDGSAPANGSATPATADQVVARTEAPAAPAAAATTGATAPTPSTGAKTDIAGLPNFGLSAATATSSTAAAAAPAAVGAANTVPIAGLAVAIAGRSQAGSNQFDISLDPPELGRIEVRLGVDRDGQVTSHVTVDRPDTLRLLQSQQPQLQHALEQAGLKTADNGLQFSLRDQSFAGQNSSNGGTPSSAAQVIIPDNDLPAVQSTQIYNRIGLGTGIDIRV
jgi:flagellar hook-length control protein FliK